jgi:hypothetical protein
MAAQTTIQYPAVPGYIPKEWRRSAPEDYAGAANDWPLQSPDLSKFMLNILRTTEPLPVDEAKFDRLTQEWRAAAGVHSSVMKIAMHPAYQQMIGMGATALPFIFARLLSEPDEPDHWFWALASISAENPVPKESRGRIAEMARAWLFWGEEKGYVKLG